MPSRFELLRNAIANLAAHADLQDQHLTAHGFTAGYGNDELALNFDDMFMAAADMIQAGELTAAQRDAALPLDQLLNRWSAQSNADFWNRRALWTDHRWEEIRSTAKTALAAYT